MPCINGHVFKTKKQSYDHVKAKIYKLGECDVANDSPENFQFFKSLVSFKIPIISWCDCAKNSHTKHDNLNEAMRHYIFNSMKQYKLKQYEEHKEKLKCVNCESTSFLQTDHVKSFYSIKNDFLKKTMYGLKLLIAMLMKCRYDRSVFSVIDRFNIG